jgi:hypothetical protein
MHEGQKKMTTTYRVTVNMQDARNANIIDPQSRIIIERKKFKCSRRTEIRSSEGDIFRLEPGSEFEIAPTMEGIQPILTGTVFIVGTTKNWHKYQTSCHSCALHSSALPLFLVRHSDIPNTDEYLILQGDLIIHDFDEHGRHFTISEAREGKKITVKYDLSKPVGPLRYTASSSDLTDEELDLLLTYIDPRGWK